MTTTKTPAETSITERLAEALDPIRACEARATPGPWRWRGNTDIGDPYLTSTGKVIDKDGRAHHAGDVLGHIPHEITRAEAERLVSLDSLPEPKIGPLPPETWQEQYDAAVEALRQAEINRIVTDKYGEPEKEWRLAFCTDWLYTEARELAIYEVAPGVTDRSDPRIYRADIAGIRHPDAVFIARSRQDLQRLLAAVEGVLEEAARAEHGALRWADPLPVPEWVGHVRERIERALRGEGSSRRAATSARTGQ
jgi:hypothetical protein